MLRIPSKGRFRCSVIAFSSQDGHSGWLYSRQNIRCVRSSNNASRRHRSLDCSDNLGSFSWNLFTTMPRHFRNEFDPTADPTRPVSAVNASLKNAHSFGSYQLATKVGSRANSEIIAVDLPHTLRKKPGWPWIHKLTLLVDTNTMDSWTIQSRFDKKHGDIIAIKFCSALS